MRRPKGVTEVEEMALDSNRDSSSTEIREKEYYMGTDS